MSINDLLWYGLFAAIQIPFIAMGYKFNLFVFVLILTLATLHILLGIDPR